MGVTCSRDSSAAFEHFCHQKKIKEGVESIGPLDPQLGTICQEDQLSKIRTLAAAEVELYTQMLEIYRVAHLVGGINQELMSGAMKRYLDVSVATLTFSPDELKELEEFKVTQGFREVSRIEVDCQGLNAAWTLQLAKLTVTCCSDVDSLDAAFEKYQELNPTRSQLQAQALASLKWRPDQGSVSIWLRDAV